ncbi:MAG: hypothetical protein MJ229_06615 [bacterium]|nr:hypothetical protein [bacterium]
MSDSTNQNTSNNNSQLSEAKKKELLENGINPLKVQNDAEADKKLKELKILKATLSAQLSQIQPQETSNPKVVLNPVPLKLAATPTEQPQEQQEPKEPISAKISAIKLADEMNIKNGVNDSLEKILESIKNKVSELKQQAGDDVVKQTEAEAFTKRYIELQKEYNNSQKSSEMFNQSANVASTYAMAFMHIKNHKKD